jgi:uncharacterized lipoprotein YddW (UPF0748 family)
MNLRKLAALFLLLSVFASCTDVPEQSTPEFWVWVHADANKTAADWELDFEKLEDAGFQGILLGANPEVLKIAIPVAQRHNLEVHAWMWTMNRGDADASWLSVNQLGNSLAQQKAYVDYYKFMCPALPEVKIFLKSKLDELCAIEGLDGIHLDYIRYVDAILPVALQPHYGIVQDSVFPEFDYGYHPYLVDLYKQKTGIDPFSLDHPATDSQWLQFRLDVLNETVIELRDYIRKQGKEATAAVFPTPGMAREMVRQEWDTWNLDAYFPMVYHNFYNQDMDWIREVMLENKSTIPSTSKIICGLYAPELKKNDDLSNAIEAALAGGATGVAIFDYRAMNDEMLDIVREFSNKGNEW